MSILSSETSKQSNFSRNSTLISRNNESSWRSIFRFSQNPPFVVIIQQEYPLSNCLPCKADGPKMNQSQGPCASKRQQCTLRQRDLRNVKKSVNLIKMTYLPFRYFVVVIWSGGGGGGLRAEETLLLVSIFFFRNNYWGASPSFPSPLPTSRLRDVCIYMKHLG